MAAGDVLMAAGDLGSEEEVDESGCLEPLFYDEAEVVAEVTAKAERRRREAEEKAAEHARNVEEWTQRNAAHQAVLDRIKEYDPKTGEVCYTRFYHKDFSRFDIDEESSVPPMRYTHRTPTKHANPRGQQVYSLWESANIFSVKIAASDVPFPLEVYGTVIARDYVDFKCVYLFRRSRDDCQIINSEDESLILTGPSRGLVLMDNLYLELDLKVKDKRHKDQELSKGLCVIDGVRLGGWDYSLLDCVDLKSRLSTVEVKFAVVVFAVEATFEIKVTKGNFCGEITAYTSSIQDCLVLHDSKAGGVTCDGSGIVQLLRRVVCVGKKEKLLLRIATASATQTVSFAPDVNGAAQVEITCGDVTMLVKVNWSLFD
ncbi:uncharacterized protein LOC124646699 [Lolium rigidum]|uniref:uncharacterized protein LOC124646699 n=1 Tax=Lolium rigidum TaxID=89674 RepID=UPI001F5C1E0E|nr:uncharacterized protein LOC124646699 [Lolium rigidum]